MFGTAAPRVDGGQHSARDEQDARRAAVLEAHDYLGLRFWNNEVIQNIDGVLESTVDTLSPSPPHPHPLPNGERVPA
jgi:very-short-patch-repair endonuclease